MPWRTGSSPRRGHDPASHLLPRLRRLSTPALVFTGRDDIVPVEVAARIAAALARRGLRVLEDCGHFAPLEAPTALRRAVDAFLDRAAAGRSGVLWTTDRTAAGPV